MLANGAVIVNVSLETIPNRKKVVFIIREDPETCCLMSDKT